MLEIIMLIIMCFSILGLIGCVLTMIRNNWVFSERMRILNQMPVALGLHDYHRLPSYETMMMKFWIWDVNKFMSPVSTFPRED